MTQEKSVSEAINYRRSVRIFDAEKSIDPVKVKECIVLASLAPNSSNMQLWEFHHITSDLMKEKMIPLCMGQNAAKTAQQLVVVVVRKDQWRKRQKANLANVNAIYGKDTPRNKQSRREKVARGYYGKLIPFAYADFLGIFGLLKYLIACIAGLFRPMYREVRKQDIRVVAHKSAALAAQNFMLSMAAVGLDTCPMEGTDTWRIKKLLNLPFGAEINMVISCGIRKPKGVYGNRYRVPFEDIYKEV